jgi:hypothetical protein
MVTRASHRPTATWLVERYQPGADVGELTRQALDLRSIAADLRREGAPLAYLGTTIVPADEAFLTVIAADSIDDVRTLFERAGLPSPRISAAVQDPPGPASASAPARRENT